jgi:hypothetical protein
VYDERQKISTENSDIRLISQISKIYSSNIILTLLIKNVNLVWW